MGRLSVGLHAKLGAVAESHQPASNTALPTQLRPKEAPHNCRIKATWGVGPGWYYSEVDPMVPTTDPHQPLTRRFLTTYKTGAHTSEPSAEGKGAY